jgi:hypothetical protein
MSAISNRFRSWWLERQVRKGRKQWGRQPNRTERRKAWGRQPDQMAVQSKAKGTISAKVIRIDGTVEDHGVIGEVHGEGKD